MAVVNFTIPETLDALIKKAVRDRGFASRAEFFRTAAIQSLEQRQEREIDWNNFPTIKLKGKAAIQADKMVKEALEKNKNGKYRSIKSFADLG